MAPPKGRGVVRPIRESRPNFAFTEQLLAKNFGGRPEEHTDTALVLWALLHGTAMLGCPDSVDDVNKTMYKKSVPAFHPGIWRAL